VELLDIHNPFNAPVYHEKTVKSTMDVSRILAAEGKPHGTVITADFQEEGRGRVRDRKWEMERGGHLAFTVLLRYSRAEDIPSAITLRTGLALALAVEDFAPVIAGKAMIKWPNDIMLPLPNSSLPPHEMNEYKKAAGVLAESESGNVHIGIGVNVSQKEFPPALSKKAVSIALAAGQDIKPGEQFKLLEKILLRLFNEIGTDDVVTFRKERIEARLYKKGGQIRFTKGAADSGDIVTGLFAGIGPCGELLVLPSGGDTEPLSFTAGELSFTS
jgi:BirA family biotin operon repressor/biotin-[acetyl-CoA-carboxylase] ligase